MRSSGMELNEAVHRIAGQRWRLIVAFVLLGAGLAVAAHRDDVPLYTATTRFVIDAEDPKSQTEAAAVADTAKAIATSPSHVAAAIRALHARGRDPVEVAERHVALRPLGTSGVLQLSVTDRSRRLAPALADELARGVIAKRLDIKRGHLREVVRRIDRRIDALTAAISRLRLAGADELRQVDLLLQRRSMLETQRLNLLATDALAARPSIISAASAPEHADPSGLLPDIVLGLMLGLVIGVGMAGLLETLSPTLIGGDSLARELDTPLLGSLPPVENGVLPAKEGGAIASRIRLAATAAGVGSVGLLASRDGLDLRWLAECLDTSAAEPDTAAAARMTVPELVAAGAPAEVPPAPAVREPVRIRAFDLERSTAATNGRVMGLVLVSRTSLKQRQVDSITHLLRISPSPLLGLITYRPPRRTFRKGLHRVR